MERDFSGGSSGERGIVLAVSSQKGGVGKTTLSLNLAYGLAQRGWRTLLIDVDPQGSIGYSLRGSLHERPGLVEVLAGAADLDQALVATRLAELSILPLGQLQGSQAAGWSSVLEDGQALGQVFDHARRHFQMIVVDTSPGVTGTTLGTLRQADAALIPLQAEPLAARSVARFLEAVAALRAEGCAVRLLGLVPTMVQMRTDASLQVVLESWELFPEGLMMEVTVPRDPVFLEASAEGVPVALLRRRPPAVAAVFDRLAAEVAARLGVENDDQDQSISLLD